MNHITLYNSVNLLFIVAPPLHEVHYGHDGYQSVPIQDGFTAVHEPPPAYTAEPPPYTTLSLVVILTLFSSYITLNTGSCIQFCKCSNVNSYTTLSLVVILT
jgi:hypothetical protein